MNDICLWCGRIVIAALSIGCVFASVVYMVERIMMSLRIYRLFIRFALREDDKIKEERKRKTREK